MRDGSCSIAELASALNRQPGGDLTADLTVLAESGFVQRYRQWNFNDPTKGELYRYRISDNYVRFYLQLIAPRRMQIQQLLATDLPPGWQTIMGLQFESLVLNHARELQQILGVPTNEILCSGPFFQTQTKRRAGCQIDYLVQTKFDTLYVCEIKFAKHPLGMDVIAEVQEKIRRLARPSGMSVRPVLIHINGVTDELLEKEFFAHIVDFADLLGKP